MLRTDYSFMYVNVHNTEFSNASIAKRAAFFDQSEKKQAWC